MLHASRPAEPMPMDARHRSRASRLPTVATPLAAGALAPGACGAHDSPSEDPAAGDPTTTTRSADAADGSPAESSPGSGDGQADGDSGAAGGDAGRVCAAIAGVQQDVARFIPDGSITDGRSFFTPASVPVTETGPAGLTLHERHR